MLCVCVCGMIASYQVYLLLMFVFLLRGPQGRLALCLLCYPLQMKFFLLLLLSSVLLLLLLSNKLSTVVSCLFVGIVSFYVDKPFCPFSAGHCIRLFRIMSIPTTFRLFRVLTSECSEDDFQCLHYYCDNVSIS